MRAALLAVVLCAGCGVVGGATPDCLDAADADQSGVHDLSDAIYVLNYLFLGGKPPPAPGPGVCGLPTDPSLGCASYTACK